MANGKRRAAARDKAGAKLRGEFDRDSLSSSPGPMDDFRVSLESVASALRCTPRRVQQLASEGEIPKAVRGKYLLFACVRGRIKQLQNKPEVANLTAERTRLTRAQARVQELRAGELEGSLLPRDEVVLCWRTHIIACRNRLRAIPKTARIRLGLTVSQCKDLLALIDEALIELPDGGAVPPKSRRRVGDKKK